MISGGISHFKESPTYVSFLIPLGIIISFISFTLKNNFKLTKKENLIVYGFIITIAILIFISLSLAASMMMDMPMGGDIFNEGH